MAFTKIDSDGMYPLNNDMNTESTTIYVGDLGGATISVGHKDPDGNWNPYPNGTLVSHTPLSISHGHDVMLIAIAVNVSGEINIETRKQGLGGLQGLLMQIEENTASPIKVEAPVGGHWRDNGQWVLDPIQTDAPQDLKPYARISTGDTWVETITHSEYDTDQQVIDDRLTVIEATIPKSINYGNSNTLPTPGPNNVTFVTFNFDQMQQPPGFGGEWAFSPSESSFTYIGSVKKAFKVIASGGVDSSSTNNTDHIYTRLIEAAGTPMTGSVKKYAAGAATGQVTSAVGFTSIGFGEFNPGDTLKLQGAKDFLGDLILTDVIVEMEPL
ncbi:hypothetical protein VPMG_00112 [Vibrio phage VBP32]|uniref:Uncharacterized protein n=2 Tax=Stoningtonvirus VBP47 TaxID=2846606 RepID=M4SQI8_9CAUD|nr:hypothetical protein VPNG_00017 [Vibrio phage VBP47]YP_007676602.1 hypothetical protein VPMG_00112 [Vibrio phage VBP32]AGH57041.1 hypothetical protein VPNG_00017 [Vibrio phage VBP47]AGH57251.1 hypothetical protein VPMG_00112 [Vibrio phage VBP32]